MKSYNQFVSEAYSAQENLHELVGTAFKLAKGGYKLGRWASKLPGARQALGGIAAGYAAAKGDIVGAGLGAGMMLPGPLGLAATGANIVRSLRGDFKGEQEKKEKKEPTQPPEKITPPEPPKETKPTKSNSKEDRERRLRNMGAEIDGYLRKIQTAQDSGRIKNPWK